MIYKIINTNMIQLLTISAVAVCGVACMLALDYGRTAKTAFSKWIAFMVAMMFGYAVIITIIAGSQLIK